MAKYNVRSNCIAPFAWSRMIGSIPTETRGAEGAGGEDEGRWRPPRSRPLAVFLASDAAKEVTRADLRRARQRDLPHVAEPAAALGAPREGWTPESIAAQAMPRMRAQFYPLDRSQDVFSWDPL